MRKQELPGPCQKCAPYGGRWAEAPRGGMTACDCPRALAIALLEVKVYRPPVLSTESIAVCVEMMGEVPFFPTEHGRRLLVGAEIGNMCETEDQAFWLAMRMVRLYRRWPGVPEMRLVFTSTHMALDGIEAVGESEVYPDGIPSERMAAPELKRIYGKPAQGEISGAPTVENTVRDLADAKRMNRTGPRKAVRDIPLRRLLPGERITPEMMREAIRKHRAQKAGEDDGGKDNENG